MGVLLCACESCEEGGRGPRVVPGDAKADAGVAVDLDGDAGGAATADAADVADTAATADAGTDVEKSADVEELADSGDEALATPADPMAVYDQEGPVSTVDGEISDEVATRARRTAGAVLLPADYGATAAAV